MAIGKRIQKQCELLDYTQDYVAEKIGMSQPNYSQIERGEIDPKFSTLERIATLFQTDVASLVGFDDKRMYFNITENKDQSQNGYIVQKDANQDALYQKLIQQYEERLNDFRNHFEQIVKIIDSKLK